MWKTERCPIYAENKGQCRRKIGHEGAHSYWIGAKRATRTDLRRISRMEELEVTEYTIKACPTIRICKSLGFPVGENRNWYILRGDGRGEFPDYWTKHGWMATTPDRFSNALLALDSYMTWLADGEQCS